MSSLHQTRISGIDAARGIAIALMVVSHTVKGLLTFKMMPDYGIVPIHLVTKISSSLFVIVFGVAATLAYIPKVGTRDWPAVRRRLVLRGLWVLIWYKLLTLVQLFQTASPRVIVDTLLWKRFPDFVEVLQFYGWFLILLPFLLPIWRGLPLAGKLLLTYLFGACSILLQQLWEPLDLWRLKAVLVEHPDVFCFGVLTRGTMVLGAMVLGELLQHASDRKKQVYTLGTTCVALGAMSLTTFVIIHSDKLSRVLVALAKNVGKHPPNLPFLLFSVGGALLVLGGCMLVGRTGSWLLSPFTALGREPLTAFNYHIIVIFVVYRYVLDLRHNVSYPQALVLTGTLLASTLLVARVRFQLRRRPRREFPDTRVDPSPSTRPPSVATDHGHPRNERHGAHGRMAELAR